MDVSAVAEYAAAGGVAAIAAATYELWQFTRKTVRYPWRGKGEAVKEGEPLFPTFMFWLCSNVLLRVAVAMMVVGLQAAAGWIVGLGAAIVIGAGSTFALSGAASTYLPAETPAGDPVADPAVAETATGTGQGDPQVVATPAAEQIADPLPAPLASEEQWRQS
ncbi:hypothetical protein [Nocardia goodfellowii]|uniref:Uncharacterized protein n=1 Tax=Nocardia goodfellowii TaxID=882446 RepID=A0ABS4QMP9_9NOCA|nr:hypothetical protein [Nocardia goodfellowii]MBP2192982.1 hypothetical protein [Nocardia goodfellowii]